MKFRPLDQHVQIARNTRSSSSIYPENQDSGGVLDTLTSQSATSFAATRMALQSLIKSRRK